MPNNSKVAFRKRRYFASDSEVCGVMPESINPLDIVLSNFVVLQKTGPAAQI